MFKKLLGDLFMRNKILGTACNFTPFGSLPIYSTDYWFFFLLPCLLSLIVSHFLWLLLIIVTLMLLLFCDNREWFLNWKASCLGSNLSQWFSIISSVQPLSRVELCDPMNHSMPGLPVHHQSLGVYPNPCPSSQWCHPTISSSVILFFSCPQSFPASGSFQMNQLFASGGQSIGVSASASVLRMNTQDWSPLGMDWLDLLVVQGTLKNLLQHHSSKASIL